jgi:hypothetical protein
VSGTSRRGRRRRRCTAARGRRPCAQRRSACGCAPCRAGRPDTRTQREDAVGDERLENRAAAGCLADHHRDDRVVAGPARRTRARHLRAERSRVRPERSRVVGALDQVERAEARATTTGRDAVREEIRPARWRRMSTISCRPTRSPPLCASDRLAERAREDVDARRRRRSCAVCPAPLRARRTHRRESRPRARARRGARRARRSRRASRGSRPSRRRRRSRSAGAAASAQSASSASSSSMSPFA